MVVDYIDGITLMRLHRRILDPQVSHFAPVPRMGEFVTVDELDGKLVDPMTYRVTKVVHGLRNGSGVQVHIVKFPL